MADSPFLLTAAAQVSSLACMRAHTVQSGQSVPERRSSMQVRDGKRMQTCRGNPLQSCVSMTINHDIYYIVRAAKRPTHAASWTC